MKLFLFFTKYFFRFFKFYWRAQTCYDVHSPFVSALVANTIEDHRWYYIFDDVTALRETLALNDDPVGVVDHGAGSQLGHKKTTSVCKIARYSAIDPAAGRLLFRICKFLHPASFLELGTSLGVSAFYQMAANRNARFITVEGNPEIAAIARQNFQKAELDQIRVFEGPFREVLPGVIRDNDRIDFFHFDGDHRFQPTVDYFEQCLQLAHNDSVFCIGDIYWSEEMERAWQQLRKHPRVRLSVDLFHFGLLFLRSEQIEKEHFTLVPSRWKPWRMGFFS
ncbi:O-methyltransferase [Flavilitoribacter nigricans]|uniref:SAM-dependent methyltransferase n=1 Tax=Flavilitoribacter nigricans (strain ATCC 23147 / DSM 23189 / NBRC 102662 / NCIMB 1420 / SS-2) TaxID=1122177 RepID=A0A2D0NJK1_FLAN2|nr:class I SAM-dependent methyltransferase [Flavilitoribacter nigricans]PHN08379.1 SAM-dependent methyltransferase [Flavilitoribacter nigricans DSM 23189 = NBRC 102662]